MSYLQQSVIQQKDREPQMAHQGSIQMLATDAGHQSMCNCALCRQILYGEDGRCIDLFHITQNYTLVYRILHVGRQLRRCPQYVV